MVWRFGASYKIFRGLRPPAPSPGAFQRGFRSRTPGISEGAGSSPQRCFASGGSTFVRSKVDGKSASPLRAGPPLLSNRTPADFAGTVPLNQQILRASDLRRAAGPASAVALLKGQMNLFSATNCLLLWEARGFSIAKKQQSLSARGPSGEVGYSPHRLRGARGLAEIQWLPGISPDGVRLDKQRGSAR